MEGLFQGAWRISGSQLLCLWKSSVSLPAPTLPKGGDQRRRTLPDLRLSTRQALLRASHRPVETFPELHCGPRSFQPNPLFLPLLASQLWGQHGGLRAPHELPLSSLPTLPGTALSKSPAYIIPFCCLLLAQRTDTQGAQHGFYL